MKGEREMNATYNIRMLRWTRHNGNCLHVYCRLRDLGVGKVWARRLARLWELASGWIIY